MKETEQNDIYSMVTDRIIEGLEAGFVPWRKPFYMPAPLNLFTDKFYRGVNYWLLAIAQFVFKHSYNYWLTFSQCKQMKGYVKRGSKSLPVVFFDYHDFKVPLSCALDLSDWTEDEKRRGFKIYRRSFLKEYKVFNLDQVELDDSLIPDDCVKLKPIEEAERVLKSYGDIPEIKRCINRCSYSPSGDFVRMPPIDYFDSIEGYYKMLFHELVHSTGHEKRLNRLSMKDLYFNSHDYSFEELVAEMGASMLCSECGILDQTIKNSISYIGGWLKALKEDKRMLVQAASKAQRAVDYILGRTYER